MTHLHVTAHAIQRYQERVRNIPDAEVIAALTSPLILKAAEFGAQCVRLPTGQRIVIKAGSVVTILPKGFRPGALDPRRHPLMPTIATHGA